MKKLTNTLMRGLVALTVAGVGLAVTPSIARADVYFSLTKVQSMAPTMATSSRKITGKYQEELNLDGLGNFTATLVVRSTAYTMAARRLCRLLTGLAPSNPR